MKIGDLVKIIDNGLCFYMWDDPYPFSDDPPVEVDKFYSGELGLLLWMEYVPHQFNKRAGGIYVKMLNPRGRIGWINGSNVEII